MANKCVEKVKIGDSVEATIASTAYAVCSTSSSIASKTAVIDGFVLMTGVTVHIKFSNSNTAKSPTLNINNTGAKDIKIGSLNIGSDESSSWNPGSIVSLTYDGIAWIMNGVVSDNCDVYINDSNGCDDAARVILGGDWRMPTSEDFNLLISTCSREEVVINNVTGIRFTSNNGNSIFFPYAGVRENNGYRSTDVGYYWSSNKYNRETNRTSANILQLAGVNFVSSATGSSYFYGLSIRPVSQTNGIDLGLSNGVKWAETNLTDHGFAENNYDFGDYYSWGETYSKETYSKTNYKFNPSGDDSTFTKYNSEDGLVVLELDSIIKAKAYYDSDANLTKIIDENGVEHIPTKSEGGSYIPYGEYVVSNNYNPQKCFEVLLEYIESGKNIDLCGYTIGLHITSQVSLNGNFVMYNGYLNIESKEGASAIPLFNISEPGIDINLNKVIIYDATHSIRLFACNGVNVGDIDINNCSFTNLRGILRIEECNVHSFKLLDSYIDGVTLTVNQGVVFKDVNFFSETILDGNTFKNCVCGFESSIVNDSDFALTSMAPYIIRNNYFDCGILENRDGNIITYHLAALIEGYKVICENNYIEQCVTYSYTTSETTAYDFYFSCREVYYNNNIINNIIGVAIGDARRVLTEVFKSKNCARAYTFNGKNPKAKRVITNNVINLNPEEYSGIDLNTYNHNNLLILQTNEGVYFDEVRMENNVFNCPNTYIGHGYFGCSESFISSGNKYYFKGNTNGYGVMNLSGAVECDEIKIINNEFILTENTDMYLLCCINQIHNLTIRNNVLDGMNGCIIRYAKYEGINSSPYITNVCNICDNKLYHNPEDNYRELDPTIEANEVLFERSFYPLDTNWSSSNLFKIRPKTTNYKIVFYAKAAKSIETTTYPIRTILDGSNDFTYKITMSYESDRHLDVITKARMWIKQEGTNYYYSKDGVNFTLVTSNNYVSMDQLTSEMTVEETDNKVRMIVYSNGEFRLIQESGPTNLVNKSDLTVTIEVIE